jgi:hypothetical protein
MRIALLCTESLRTPACPGFGVSGDRKISCFDRFGRQRQVARELRLWGDVREGFERVQMRRGLGSRGGHVPCSGGLFERVQMEMGFGVQGFAARMADWFVRGQLSRRSALRVTRAAASVECVRVSEEPHTPAGAGCPSVKAFEAAWESGVRDPARASIFGPFERVQMSGECPGPEADTAVSAAPFERVQMTGALVNGRGAMPHLK